MPGCAIPAQTGGPQGGGYVGGPSKPFPSCGRCASWAWIPHGRFADRAARRLRELRQLCDEGTSSSTTPTARALFLPPGKRRGPVHRRRQRRPIAYKLGVGFCDHNHERKEPLAGFTGMLNFAREVYNTVASRCETQHGPEVRSPSQPRAMPASCARPGRLSALRGVAGAVPFLHGSQGCATYIRRYLISHFREPVDIAVSGFSEATTVFGGATTCAMA